MAGLVWVQGSGTATVQTVTIHTEASAVAVAGANALEVEVLQMVGEDTTSPDVYTDITPIRDSVNAAIQELCMVTGSVTATYHLPLEAGRNYYRTQWTDGDLGYVLNCRDVERKYALSQTDPATMSSCWPDHLKTTGYPTQYYQIGQKYLGLDRAPSASGGLLEIDCVIIPAAYTTDASPIPLRYAFQRAAVYYACSEFYASRGDAGRAQEMLQKYLETAGVMALSPQAADRQWMFQTDKTGRVIASGYLPR